MWTCGNCSQTHFKISALTFQKVNILENVEHVGYIFLETCVFSPASKSPSPVRLCRSCLRRFGDLRKQKCHWIFRVCILRILRFLIISAPTPALSPLRLCRCCLQRFGSLKKTHTRIFGVCILWMLSFFNDFRVVFGSGLVFCVSTHHPVVYDPACGVFFILKMIPLDLLTCIWSISSIFINLRFPCYSLQNFRNLSKWLYQQDAH